MKVEEVMAARFGYDIETYRNIWHAIWLWEDKAGHSDFWYTLDDLSQKIEQY